MVLRTVLTMSLATVAAQSQDGVVREWSALLSTRDGMRANEYLKNKAQPDRDRLERMESDMDHDRTRLAAEKRDKWRWLPWRTAGRKRLERRVANESKDYSIAREASVQSFERERQRILALLRARLVESINAYSQQNRCSLTLDSDPDLKPRTAGPEDFTVRVVHFYDATHPEALRF
jgi:hypothetical protein